MHGAQVAHRQRRANWLTMHGPGDSTRAGAGPAVAAVAADPTRQEAASGNAETQGALCEDLSLDTWYRGGGRDLGQGHLPGQHHPQRPKVAGRRDVGTVGHTRLRTEMEFQLGVLTPQGQQGRVADQNRIDPCTARQFQDPRRLAQLAVVQVDVQGQINARAPPMGGLDCPGQLLLSEVARPPPRIQHRQAQVDRVGAGIQGGVQGRPFTRWGQDLQSLLGLGVIWNEFRGRVLDHRWLPMFQ